MLSMRSGISTANNNIIVAVNINDLYKKKIIVFVPSSFIRLNK